MEIAVILFVIAVIFVFQSIKVVPQQHAWVVERLGKYNGTLTPGLNFLVPFIDKVAYKHVLKEIPLDIPSQVCITRDNTQLQVDGILYFQVTDAMRASYGSSNYIMAISQLAQTTLRSVIGKLELDKTFEERAIINAQVVNAIDEAALNWGVKVLRYEIKDLTPPKEILHAMQQQITAEREKRALIAASEGRRQEQINIATGEREAFIARSEGEKQAAINNAQRFIEVQKEIGSFDVYIWGFVNGKPIQNGFKSLQEIPAKTPLSDAISKDLKARGFKFVGSTIIYAHLQATGMVNDHTVDCFRYKEVDR